MQSNDYRICNIAHTEDPDPDWQPLAQRLTAALCWLLPLLVLISFTANATEPGSGMLRLLDSAGQTQTLPSLDTRVEYHVTGLVAEVAVKQSFRNKGIAFLEGEYLLPLPVGAAVYDMRVQIGERVIVGHVREKEAARRVFAQARASGKRAALVEADGNNLFRTAVTNVAAGESVTVELRYWQRIDYQGDHFSLRFPLTYTPRYRQADAATPTSTGANTQGPELFASSQAEPPLRTHITVELDAGVPLASVASASHPITRSHKGNVWSVHLRDSSVLPDRDFTLEWTPQPLTQPNVASFQQVIDGERYAMLMLMPPQQQASTLPRELILVIDTSGSMGGGSIRQARAALDYALAHLKPRDRFNVIEFNSIMRPWRPQAVAASADAVADARQWVAGLNADGGTEMAPALRFALGGHAPEGYVRQVVFVTDGAVGDPTGLMQIVDTQLGASRLFPVGIGSAPNAEFLQTAAQHGRGSETVIGDEQQVGEKMQQLLAKLNHPALSDLSIDWPAGTVAYPKPLPDLYLGEPLLVTARLGQSTLQVQVHGRLADRDWTNPVRLDTARSGQGLDRLWAHAHIADLEEQIDRGGSLDTLRQAIVKTALTAHLVSRFTSLVAVDETPVRPPSTDLHKAQIPNVLPAGSAFAQTATPARLEALLALLCALLAACAWIIQRRSVQA